MASLIWSHILSAKERGNYHHHQEFLRTFSSINGSRFRCSIFESGTPGDTENEIIISSVTPRYNWVRSYFFNRIGTLPLALIGTMEYGGTVKIKIFQGQHAGTLKTEKVD
jgi:hypothetical protein